MNRSKTFALILAGLSLTALASADGTSTKLTNPEMVELKTSLTNTTKFLNPQIDLLLTRSKDSSGNSVFSGNMAFAYHNAAAPLTYAFALTKITSFSDDGKTVYFKGIGTMLNIESKKSMTCNVEFVLQDNQNSASKAGTPGDSFGIHFWNDGTDFNMGSTWSSPTWQAVEVYRP